MSAGYAFTIIRRLLGHAECVPGPMSTPCLIPALTLTKDGYTRIRGDDGRKAMGHRLTYEYFVGPIPDGLEIDHLCRVRACVNPGHLEAVTKRENWKRGNQQGAVSQRTNTCRNGHSLGDAYISGGRRYCRPCLLTRQLTSRRRNRAA